MKDNLFDAKTPMGAQFHNIFTSVQQVIVGNESATVLLMCALLARGHVLIEDIPGVGKTLLAHTLAQTTALEFGRVQCTPDILPSDIIGFTLVDIHSGETTYKKGAVMNHMLLVDEINRASPKTQSALLEVMEESQVTVDGVTRPLPQPFMAIATQNPVESVGTSPLPEAQLDRFMMRLSLGYPAEEEELLLLERFQSESPLNRVSACVTREEVLEMQRAASRIGVSEAVRRYIVELCRMTRKHSSVLLGASPRAALALMHAAQALALLRDSFYVTPDEVKALAVPVLAHRLILASRASGRSNSEQQRDVIGQIVSQLHVPTR